MHVAFILLIKSLNGCDVTTIVCDVRFYYDYDVLCFYKCKI